MIMSRFRASAVVLGLFYLSSVALPAAEVPPLDRILPASTLAALIVPDAAAAREGWEQSAMGRLLADPEMEPFLTEVRDFWNRRILEPLAVETGIDFAEAKTLFERGFALAMLPDETDSDEVVLVGLFVAEGPDAEEETALLERLTSEWPGARRSEDTFRGVRIRRVEFETRTEVPGEVGDADAEETGADAVGTKTVTEKHSIWFAGHEGLCIVVSDGTGRGPLEEIIGALDAGGTAGGLASAPEYEATLRRLERPGLVRFFASPSKFLQHVIDPREIPQAALWVDALGLKGFEGILAEGGRFPDADWGFGYLYMPGGKRGLLKIFDLHEIDTDPPPFVDADVASYAAYGLDLSEVYAELMNVLQTVSPEMYNALRGALLMFSGRGGAEGIDIEKDLIGSLGPGIMTVSSYPRPYKAQEQREYVLLGARDPQGFVEAFRTLLRPSPEAPSMLEERDYLGHPIFSIAMPVPPAVEPEAGGETPETPEFCITPLADFLAYASDSESLESLVRSLERRPEKTLADSAVYRRVRDRLPPPRGYQEYDNLKTMMEYLDTVRSEIQAEIAPFLDGEEAIPLPGGGEIRPKELFAFLDLLPPPERVARHFGVTLTTGGPTPEGFVFHSLSPDPVPE